MTVYILTYIVITVMVVVSSTKASINLRKMLYRLGMLILFFLSAFRGVSVGADTQNYCDGFHKIRELSFVKAMKFPWEQGYVLVNWLIGYFTEDERILLVFLSIVILCPIFIWIKNESLSLCMSLIVFMGTGLWTNSMCVLRQWCAIAILTFSYRYIKRENFIRFLALVFVAALFHRTAVIFMLAYFVRKIKVTDINLILSGMVSVVLAISGKFWLEVLNRFARIKAQQGFNGGISMFIFLWMCVIVIYMCFRGKIPSELQLYYKILLLAAVMQPMAFTFSIWSRVIRYFTIPLIILIPNSICYLTKSYNRKFRLPINMIVCMLLFVWFWKSISEPYAFML